MKRALVLFALMLAACGKLLGLSEEEEVAPTTLDASTDAAVVDSAVAETSVDAGATDALARERVVFVTSATKNGDLGGVAGADKRCNDEAKGHPRVTGRSFVAWLSTVEEPAAERHVHGTQAYVLPSGVKVAEDWLDLVDGTIKAPIDELPDGGRLDAGTYAWTGTRPNGTTGLECLSWTAGATERGITGRIGDVDGGWTDIGQQNCTLDAHLYCIEK